jgi:N-acetylglucosamine-6-phosphate deacetylase
MERRDRMTGTSSFALRGKLLLGTHLEPGTVIVEGDRIASISRGHARDGDLPGSILDVDIVAPGLIDLQVNGGWGREATSDPRDIDHISREMLQTGVTAWLPTIVSSAAETYPPLFEAWPGHDPHAGSVPLGYHLEGPFLTLEKKGAHRPEFIEAADESLFSSWLGQESIRLVTLSPERPGAPERIRRLVEAGVLVSLGHTNATYEEFVAGIDAGARKATHLYNAMTAIHHRSPGAMVGTLVDDRVTAGLIPDGVHSHPATVRLAIKSKGVDNIVIVSDMMSACGLGPGTYPLGTMEVTVTEDSARLADGTLAGSILTMDEALRNLVGWSDASAGEALHMMTAVPARLLGDMERGRLVTGARADISTWDSQLRPLHTVVGGRLVWQREE